MNIKLSQLSKEFIENMGDYGINKEEKLQQFVVHQNDKKHCTDQDMWDFINTLENHVYHYADQKSEGQYSGGYWTMEQGFFELVSQQNFKIDAGYGRVFEVNSTEFSIIVNLFALSHIAFSSYENKDNFRNSMAVFLSDYIKDLMNFNSEVLKTGTIYTIID